MKTYLLKLGIRARAVWNLLASDSHCLITGHGECVVFNRIMATDEAAKLMRYYATEIDRRQGQETALFTANQILNQPPALK